MFLVEFTLGVCHFRLNPDAEFDAVLLGSIRQTFDTERQFALVDTPVTQ